jgi:hypothetical protein
MLTSPVYLELLILATMFACLLADSVRMLAPPHASLFGMNAGACCAAPPAEVVLLRAAIAPRGEMKDTEEEDLWGGERRPPALRRALSRDALVLL